MDGFVKVDGMRGSRLAFWEMSFVLQMTHLSSSAFPAGEGFRRGGDEDYFAAVNNQRTTIPQALRASSLYTREPLGR